MEKNLHLIGAGGGKKPKQQAAPVEAKNTLRSVSKGRILDLVGYGPIKGPVDGLKSIFLDDTPVQNADGSLNFEGIDIDFRHGDPDQEVIPGFIDISNPREINAEIKQANPIVRSLLNNDVDAVLVTVRVPALVATDSSTGNTNPASLPLYIQVLDHLGNQVSSATDVIRGKNTAPYEKSYRLEVKGTGPFTVKVGRSNKESDTGALRDALTWAYLNEIIDVRQNYPNCALFGLSVDAQLFGNTIPSRKYLIDLSIVKVPSNYDPITRVYTGFWDGTFKEAWTDNPAWCYYDLATHPIIGAGIKEVNKWALYEISKYCDALVDDGYGGMEPRFTCNTIFSAPEDAITALNTLASVFRGMTYWGSNTVEPVADMPGPIRKIITPSDVVSGEFTYSGTSLKERHSVAIVMWNDPEDGYVAKPEMVEDPESIELLGWRELQLTAVACSSRGQARRLGLWALYSERAETQSVNFTVTAKHADMRPGDFFEIQDPYRAGARLGGKISGITGNKVVVDAVPDQLAVGWKITVETEEGGLEQLTITGIAGTVLTLNALPTRPVVVGASFILSSAALSAQTFRVSASSEQEGSTYGITATAHNPLKYQHIEEGLVLPDAPISFMPTGRIGTPKAITAETYTYHAGGTEHQGLTIGWTAPDDARVDQFVLDIKGPDDIAFGTAYFGDALSYDLPLAPAGQWYFRVRAVSKEWGNSAWTEAGLVVTNLLEPSPPTSLIFKSTSNTVTVLPVFTGVNTEFEFWRSATALTDVQILDNATYLGTGTFFVDSNLTYDTTYYYYVRGVNLYGHSLWVPGNVKTKADVDDILNVILQEQQESPVGQWFQKEIAKISGTGTGSVNDRVEAARQSLQTEIDALQAQVAAFDTAAVWVPSETYLKDAIIQYDGKLWKAKQNVPVGVTPVDPSVYWLKIGDFVSLTDGIADLALRVQDAEVTVVELDGKVTPLATQISSLSARWRELEEDEDGYLQAGIRAWDSRANFNEEVVVRANQDEALSQRITTLSSNLGAMGSEITELERSLTTEVEAVAQTVTQLKAAVDTDIAAALLEEKTARVAADSALVASVSALQIKVNQDITAALNSEASLRYEADQLIGDRIDAMLITVGANSAAITAESSARVTQDQALSSRIDTTQASVDGIGASVQTIQQAQASTSGALSAMWGVKLQLNQNNEYVTAGVGLGIDNVGGILQSNFIVEADRFSVINGIDGAKQNPFTVDGDKVIIKTAFIGDATINMAKIGGDLYSTDYQVGVRGWKLSRNGDFEINSSTDGLGRILVNNKGMKVFDAFGQVRVKIGDLTD